MYLLNIFLNQQFKITEATKMVQNRNKGAGENTRFSNNPLRMGKVPRCNKAKILESSTDLNSAQKAAQFVILEDMITTNY